MTLDQMHPEPVIKDVVGYPSEHDLDLFVPVNDSVQATRDFLLTQPPPEEPLIRTDYQLFPGDGSLIEPTGTIPEAVNFLSRFSKLNIYFFQKKNGRRRVDGAAPEKPKGQQTCFGGCDFGRMQ